MYSYFYLFIFTSEYTVLLFRVINKSFYNNLFLFSTAFNDLLAANSKLCSLEYSIRGKSNIKTYIWVIARTILAVVLYNVYIIWYYRNFRNKMGDYYINLLSYCVYYLLNINNTLLNLYIYIFFIFYIVFMIINITMHFFNEILYTNNC